MLTTHAEMRRASVDFPAATAPVIPTTARPPRARAAALLGRVGLDAARVVTGDELEALDAEDFARAAREVSVFARATPEHKLRLVEALQADGGGRQIKRHVIDIIERAHDNASWQRAMWRKPTST